jgi:hypothetical protein
MTAKPSLKIVFDPRLLPIELREFVTGFLLCEQGIGLK